MSWLAKVLKYTPAKDREGIALQPEDIMWEVSPTRNLSIFLRCLPDLMPAQSILYLEGHLDEAQANLLEPYQATRITKVAVGTIWPRPRWYHFPITPEIMDRLGAFAETADGPEIVN